MKEENHRLWDIRIRIITALATLSAIFVGINQFNAEQRTNLELEYEKIRKNDSIRTQQRLWENKIQTYVEIGTSIGEILSLDLKDSAFDHSIDEFEKLYYGKSIIVEDSAVNETMTNFRRSILDYERGFIDKNRLKSEGMMVVSEIKRTIGIKPKYNKK